MKTNLYIELNGHQTDDKSIVDQVKEAWKAMGNKMKDLQTLDIYYKPDEHTCYYVANGEVKGSIQL